jgi:arylsulfatase
LLESRYLVMAASVVVSEFIKTFKDFPPRQKAANFTIDQAMEKMERRQRRPALSAAVR